MKIEGVFEIIQDEIEKRLLSLNELRNIPILTYKQSDLASTIKASIKTGIGTAILLMPPASGDVIQHVLGPAFNSITIEIKIVENTIANKNGKSLLFLAETVMRYLHMWKFKIFEEGYQLHLSTGGNCCQAFREDDINHFIIRFTTPCYLESV